MFNAKPLEIIKAQKSLSQSMYILTARGGQQVALDTKIYATNEDMIAAIESGVAGATSANALELMTLIAGPGAVEGLAREIAQLTDLVTIYEAGTGNEATSGTIH